MRTHPAAMSGCIWAPSCASISCFYVSFLARHEVNVSFPCRSPEQRKVHRQGSDRLQVGLVLVHESGQHCTIPSFRQKGVWCHCVGDLLRLTWQELDSLFGAVGAVVGLPKGKGLQPRSQVEGWKKKKFARPLFSQGRAKLLGRFNCSRSPTLRIVLAPWVFLPNWLFRGSCRRWIAMRLRCTTARFSYSSRSMLRYRMKWWVQEVLDEV